MTSGKLHFEQDSDSVKCAESLINATSPLNYYTLCVIWSLEICLCFVSVLFTSRGVVIHTVPFPSPSSDTRTGSDRQGYDGVVNQRRKSMTGELTGLSGPSVG